ncbi:unnamed protein product [Notodromas monacha]|uniref:Transmembrane protein 19 n=1 Tax=Notodromas monacha TaxID=399045 RepID=A0A7R9GCV4_9CRUS|nr:unnamed protein product [Notodromas monacha]CAG0916485.1 unnamed protein product [Notodromas monacha]
MADETCKIIGGVGLIRDAKRRRRADMYAVLAFGLLLQFSGLFWLVNSYYSYSEVEDGDPSLGIPAYRWLFAVIMPVMLSSYGYYKRSLNFTGAFTALFVGFFIGLSSFCFSASLIAFFITSSRVTKYGAKIKRGIEGDFKEGGQRNWCQVVSNGAMAAELAILYLIDVGVGERPVDFIEDYRPSYMGMAILGAVACVNGDTWASELGTIVSTTSCRLVTTGRMVPRGTNGGVTLGGLVFSLLGGLVVGFAYYVALITCLSPRVLAASPRQWPIVLVGGLGGLTGSLIDSLLGATLQFSGVDETSGKIVEKPGEKVKRISGIPLLDNCSVNLVSSVVNAFLVAEICKYGWS